MALRFKVEGQRELPHSFLVLVIEHGSGTIERGDDRSAIQAGETWVVPYAAGPAILSGTLDAIVCLPAGSR